MSSNPLTFTPHPALTARIGLSDSENSVRSARSPIARSGVFLLIVASTVGCQDPGWDLDYMAESIEKYGTVTISGATLIEPDPDFNLDLDLSAKEIFERNRIEGFSNIFQQDEADLQISGKAEVVATMLDQMQGTTDPGMLASMREKLMAAAFGGLIATLPPDKQALFQTLLKPAEPAKAPAANDANTASGDGGQAELEAARNHLAAAQDAFKTAVDSKTSEDAEADATKKEPFKLACIASAEKTLNDCKAAAGSAKKAVEGANTLALEAEVAARKAAGNVPGPAQPQVDDAKAKSEAAKTKAEEEITKIDETLKVFADKATLTCGAAVDAAKPFQVDSVPALLKTTESAVNSARAAIAAAGKSPASAGPKIIEAPEIEKEKRLALARLQKERPPLANPTVQPELNLRQLLMLTASDKMTLEMLRWLSYPRNIAPNQKVYLCMASVNVVPGRWTGSGYNAQVDLFMELGRPHPITGEMIVPRNATIEPTTFAVFPFIDSQVLDLRTSRRQTFTMAMQLILNGYPAAGRALLDVARLREQDVQTTTGLNTVTSFSNGRHVGFTFSPRLQAQGDPSDLNTRPLMNLQPQTFPVMVMVTIDDVAEQAFEKKWQGDYLRDGGQAELETARNHLAEAQDAFKTAAESKTSEDAEADATKKEPFKLACIASAEKTLNDCKAAAGSAKKAAEGANTLALEAEVAARKAAGNVPGPAQPQVDDAKAKSEAAKTKAEEENTKIDEAFKLVADKTTLTCGAAVDAARPFQVDSVPALLKTTESAVNSARAAIAAVGSAAMSDMDPNTPTHLLWYQTHRWMRAPSPSADKWPLIGRPVSEWLTPRLSEQEMLGRAKAADRAYNWSKEERKKSEARKRGKAMEAGDPYVAVPHGWQRAKLNTYEERAVQRRVHYLDQMGNGTVATFALPNFKQGSNEEIDGTGKPKPCAEIKVTTRPSVGWIDKPNTFFIEARGIHAFDKGFAVSIGGRTVNASRLSDTVLKVVMPPWMDVVDTNLLTQGKEDLFKAPVVVTNGACVFEAGEVKFQYYSLDEAKLGSGSDLSTLTATFVGTSQTIDPSAANDPDRVIRIKLSERVPTNGTQCVIKIADPCGTKTVDIKADVDSAGNVTSSVPITAKRKADGTAEWLPPGVDALAGLISCKTVGLVVTFAGGGVLNVPVKGELSIKSSPIAKLAGVTIDPRASNREDRYIRIDLSERAASEGTQCVIRLPSPVDSTKRVDVPARVDCAGKVKSESPIAEQRTTGGPWEWSPTGIAGLEAVSTKDIQLILTFVGGEQLKLPVEGTLTINPSFSASIVGTPLTIDPVAGADRTIRIKLSEPQPTLAPKSVVRISYAPDKVLSIDGTLDVAKGEISTGPIIAEKKAPTDPLIWTPVGAEVLAGVTTKDPKIEVRFADGRVWSLTATGELTVKKP